MRKRKLSNTVIFVIGFLTANCLIKFLRKCMSRHFENVLSSFFNLNGFHREYTLRLCEIKWPQGLMFWGFRHTAANQFLQTYHKVQISTRGSTYLQHIVYSYQALFVNFHSGPISTVPLFFFFAHSPVNILITSFTWTLVYFGKTDALAYETDQKLWKNSHGGGGPTVRENTIKATHLPTV